MATNMIETTDISEVRTGGNTGAVGQATQQGSGIAVGSKATGGVGGGDERSVHFQAGTNLQATGSKEDMIKVSQNKKRILNEYKNKNFRMGALLEGSLLGPNLSLWIHQNLMCSYLGRTIPLTMTRWWA